MQSVLQKGLGRRSSRYWREPLRNLWQMEFQGPVQLPMHRDVHVGALAADKNPKTHRFTKIMLHLPCLTMPSPPTHGQIDDCRLSQRSRIFLAARQIRSGVSSHYSRDKSGVIPTIPSLHPVIQEMGYHTVNAFFISQCYQSGDSSHTITNSMGFLAISRFFVGVNS